MNDKETRGRSDTEIRGGQIWTQEGFPCFSVMLVLMGYDRKIKDTTWIMISDPRKEVGNIAIGWNDRIIWTKSDLQAFLARPAPFTYRGQLYDLLTEERHAYVYQEDPR